MRAADYEAYLAQYPEGNFVALARARLAELLESGGAVRDPAEREIELAFWESVRERDNAESLQAYLDKYPDRRVRRPGRDPPQGIRTERLAEEPVAEPVVYWTSTRRPLSTAERPCSGGTSATSQPGITAVTFIDTST